MKSSILKPSRTLLSFSIFNRSSSSFSLLNWCPSSISSSTTTTTTTTTTTAIASTPHRVTSSTQINTFRRAYTSTTAKMSSSKQTMKAVVIHTPGPPSNLKIEQRPVPVPEPGWVLIRVKAFGLNRSEMFTRQGLSPVSAVKFPRILGIEATGIVESAPGGEFQRGQVVGTCMGGMGRAFDGGYAEYTSVPAGQVRVILDRTVDPDDEAQVSKIKWDVLGALPEMMQTAWGSLTKALKLQSGDRLLVRGGTSSVGLAAIGLAKQKGAFVAATTRKAEREALLREQGADEVYIDDGAIAKQIERKEGGLQAHGFDKLLELVGATTTKDSMHCLRPGGLTALAGIVGNEWVIKDFTWAEFLPNGTYLTGYGGSVGEFQDLPLKEIVEQIEAGSLKVKIGKVFTIDEIVEAHASMEESRAEGKIVVLA